MTAPGAGGALLVNFLQGLLDAPPESVPQSRHDDADDDAMARYRAERLAIHNVESQGGKPRQAKGERGANEILKRKRPGDDSQPDRFLWHQRATNTYRRATNRLRCCQKSAPRAS